MNAGKKIQQYAYEKLKFISLISIGGVKFRLPSTLEMKAAFNE